jgi:hypothetical protein
MNMSLEIGNVIYIHGFKREKPNFSCLQHFKDLIGLPTRVFLNMSGTIYVTHPILDVVPLYDCVNYEVLEDVDLGYHKDVKNKLNLMAQMGASRIPVQKVKKLFKRKLDEQEEDKVSPREQSILNIIEQINNGELDEEFLNEFFGGLDRFLNLVDRKGLLHLIDPFASELEDIQNSILYAFYQRDKNFIYEIVNRYLSDIESDGTDYYYSGDHDELAGFFTTSRNDISEKTISEILSGEYDPWSYGGFDTDDEYDNVYTELDHYAKSVVDEYIVNELKDMKTMKFSTHKRTPELLSDIAEEQGNEEEITLTDEVITRLMSDDDCLKYLINKELDDVGSNLNNIYSGCYGDILSTEWYNDLWLALEGEVVDSREGIEYSYKKSVWQKDGTRGSKTVYGKKYKVTKCVYDVVKGWLEVNKEKGGYNNNTIEYFGSYNALIKDAMEYGPMDWIRVPVLDDYPDWRKMQKCMNDSVENYF